MLALCRVERVTIAYQISKSLPLYFQKCYSCVGVNYNYKMQGGNSNKRTAERKTQKPTTSAWRSVSMQSSSAAGMEADEPDEPNIGPTTLSDKAEDKHSISLQVGSSLFRFIKGKGGSTQEQIEKELGIRIIFPSSRNDESIIIEGTSPDSVSRATERIQLIIDEAVKSSALDYSHFISLPLAINPQLVDKLVNFQNSVLEINDATTYEEGGGQKLDEVSQVAVTFKAQEASNVEVGVTKIPLVSYPPKFSATSSSRQKASTLSELGIDKSIFIKPKTFHLTVLMLKLWNKERVDTAVKIFEGIKEEIMDALEGRPVSIRLKGLDCMKGSPAKARVLYTPVEVLGGEDRLLLACKVISDAFTKGGLVLEKDAKQTLKLHATVMNARHRKRTRYTKKFDSFDARGVMEKYGSEEWGEYPIPEVHLSQRFVFDENGYYHCCASIPLPKNM